jgi:hypothetical protein
MSAAKSILVHGNQLTIIIPALKLKVSVVPVKRCGLEVYEVRLNQTYLTEYLSAEAANTRAHKLVQKLIAEL